jgi:hypothetical protein
MSDLHAAIMNLPCRYPADFLQGDDWTTYAYKTGHKDARHAAAELASEYAASHQRLKEALELIAGTDPVDAALDPHRAVRVAQEALRSTP